MGVPGWQEKGDAAMEVTGQRKGKNQGGSVGADDEDADIKRYIARAEGGN
jgi:hypothetical protein